MIGNKIRADATLRLGPEALLEGHKGQMIFHQCSCLMDLTHYQRSKVFNIRDLP